MKLLNSIERKESIEIQIQKRQNKEKFKFLGSLKPKANQRCFELDLKTMTVKESEYFYASDTIDWFEAISNKKPKNNRSVMVKPDHDYVVKLNLENAVKYFKKVWCNDSIKY